MAITILNIHWNFQLHKMFFIVVKNIFFNFINLNVHAHFP